MRFSCGSLRSARRLGASEPSPVCRLRSSAASKGSVHQRAHLARAHLIRREGARLGPPQHQQQPRRRHGARYTCGAAWSKYAGVFSKTKRPATAPRAATSAATGSAWRPAPRAAGRPRAGRTRAARGARRRKSAPRRRARGTTGAPSATSAARPCRPSARQCSPRRAGRRRACRRPRPPALLWRRKSTIPRRRRRRARGGAAAAELCSAETLSRICDVVVACAGSGPRARAALGRSSALSPLRADPAAADNSRPTSPWAPADGRAGAQAAKSGGGARPARRSANRRAPTAAADGGAEGIGGGRPVKPVGLLMSPPATGSPHHRRRGAPEGRPPRAPAACRTWRRGRPRPRRLWRRLETIALLIIPFERRRAAAAGIGGVGREGRVGTGASTQWRGKPGGNLN